MRRHGLFAALMIVGGLVAGQASAGVLYLVPSTTTSVSSPTPSVPDIYLDPAGILYPSSMYLFMYYQLPTNEKVNGLTVDLVMDNPGHVVSSAGPVVPSPLVQGVARWNAGKVNGTIGAADKLLAGQKLFAVTENGINGYFNGLGYAGALDPTYNNGSFQVARITISAVGMPAGTTNVWITTNDGGGISYAEGQYPIGEDPDTFEPIFGTWNNPATTGFGTANDQVNPRTAGVTGAVADAIIHVVPEPASLSLLALGGLALARRRRA